jgi:hypothetical protein
LCIPVHDCEWTSQLVLLLSDDKAQYFVHKYILHPIVNKVKTFQKNVNY